MPVKCTYGDLDKLRGAPRQKIWNHTFSSPLDGHRVRSWWHSLATVVGEYEAELLKLAEKFGTKRGSGVQIPADKLPEYLEAKLPLDAVEREITLVPLPYSTWSQVPLSAADQEALEKFVEPAAEEIRAVEK